MSQREEEKFIRKVSRKSSPARGKLAFGGGFNFTLDLILANNGFLFLSFFLRTIWAHPRHNLSRTFWFFPRHLRSVTEQTHGNMESICQPHLCLEVLSVSLVN